MPTVRFLGKVLPAPVQISFTDIPLGKWKWEEEGINIGISVRINRSFVEVDCEVPTYKSEYFVELYRRAFDVARTCVNVAAFATGYGVSLVLESFVGPDGTVSQIMFRVPDDIVAQCTAFKMNPETLDERRTLEQVLTLMMTELPLFGLLNDLIQCTHTSHVTPTNCARVIDGLRKLIVPGIEPAKAWPLFRDAMHVDEAYTKFISEHSKDTRHGGSVRIDGPNTMEILKRTWIIMNRFIHFRKCGNQPLPLTDFPLLAG